nr:LysR family transcriptional regulator [Desulfobulbaceae bacterium]
MDIHHLRIFAAVYRSKSFTKAARETNISQPTVSEHVKNLESELDCRLFDRVGKTIEPTASARKLYPKALQIIDELSLIKAEIIGGENAVKGEIVFGASTIPSTYILPAKIKQFQKIYPDIFFQIRIEDSLRINQLIMENELSCGIVGAKIETNSLQYEPFFKDQLILVASPKLIQKKTLQLKELSRLPFVLREKGSGTRKSMEENFKRIGFAIDKKQVAAEFSSTAAIKEAAKHEIGVAIISQIAVRDELKNGSLREIAMRNEKMERYFYLVSHKNRTLPTPYLKFCQFLKQQKSETKSTLIGAKPLSENNLAV